MKKARILIVEDEGITGSYIESTLEELGYEVISIEFSAEEALQKVEQETPDLVLMDVKLQGEMDGIEAAGHIRSTYNIPVIYLTAHSNKDILDRAKLTESFGYIIKPFEKKELYSNIEMALYKHRVEEKSKRNYDIQQVVNSVLQVSLKSMGLEKLLERILDLLLSVSWLSFQSKGCIFLKEDDSDTLVMKAHRNLKKEQLTTCSKVPIGVCLCGKAASEGKIVFSDCLSEDHEIKYKNIDPHGHYCVPIASNRGLLGVINMYVREGHKRDKDEENYLRSIATTIAGIIERKMIEQRLEYLVNFDALTGLPGRKLFFDRLSNNISLAKRDNYKLGLLFLDLDHFKYINDNLGHDYGDIVLSEVTKRIKECLRSSDTLSRLSGDEFMVILTKIEREVDAAFVAQKIITAISAPFNLNEKDYSIGVSIGISIYPNDGDDDKTLFKNSDTAMSQAKECAGSDYRFYSADMGEVIMRRLSFENEMRLAVEKKAFTLHYHPIVDIKTLSIAGVEALLRWEHPEYGMVQLSDMIPVAENSGLIISIGEWALKEACEQIKELHSTGFPSVRMSVNLSICQFIRQKNLFEMIAQILFESNLKPEYLDLEITENICMENMSETALTIKELHEMGTLLSIDDFGAGLSSLSLLKHLPVQRLKIDRTFIENIPVDSCDTTVVRAITTIAHGMGLKVVAEGVETMEQLDFIRTLQCDEAQGFLFSRPVPGNRLIESINNISDFLRKLSVNNLRRTS